MNFQGERKMIPPKTIQFFVLSCQQYATLVKRVITLRIAGSLKQKTESFWAKSIAFRLWQIHSSFGPVFKYRSIHDMALTGLTGYE